MERFTLTITFTDGEVLTLQTDERSVAWAAYQTLNDPEKSWVIYETDDEFRSIKKDAIRDARIAPNPLGSDDEDEEA